MKQSRIAVAGFVTLLAITPIFASPAKKAETQASLQKEAKISMEKAREIALKEAAGKVESSELEREHNTLVYSFDIRNAKGTIDEVLVSAYDGKIVAHEHENKAKEAAEKKQEAKEKAGKKH
ncbi:MAG: hypothetical protein JWO56_807 [Acidobacteria bacterium]|nr:hypothetical protein [Acidobacteriota bacterium]